MALDPKQLLARITRFEFQSIKQTQTYLSILDFTHLPRFRVRTGMMCRSCISRVLGVSAATRIPTNSVSESGSKPGNVSILCRSLLHSFLANILPGTCRSSIVTSFQSQVGDSSFGSHLAPRFRYSRVASRISRRGVLNTSLGKLLIPGNHLSSKM
jgi:hypothetical protein